VVASVNLTTRNGTISFVHPVMNLPASPIDREGQVVIRTKGQDGTPLGDFPVPVKLDSELSPEDDRMGLVDAVLSVSAETRIIELVIDGQIADTFEVGGPPPVPRAVQPVALDGRELRMAVQFDRELQGKQTYAVQVSTDHGDSWQTIGVGLKEPVFILDRSQLSVGQEVEVRVITTNGLASCTVTGQPFRIANPDG
jgi:hypothetical protein